MITPAANRVLDDALAAGPRCGSSVVIAIDGPAGSGKTTLAGEIATLARARALTFELVHTDALCPGWQGLVEVPGIVAGLLRSLAEDQAATCPIWDWHRDRPGEPVTVSPADLILIEGVGSGAARNAGFLSVRLLLQAPEEQRRARALARDGETFAPFWDVWAEAERRYFATEWSQA